MESPVNSALVIYSHNGRSSHFLGFSHVSATKSLSLKSLDFDNTDVAILDRRLTTTGMIHTRTVKNKRIAYGALYDSVVPKAVTILKI